MSANPYDPFIELDRTFSEIPKEASRKNDDTLDIKTHQILQRNNALFHWPDLLKEYRLVILAEAGSGKTWEIKNMARKLAKQGKGAFFLRLEFINGNFEDSFETETFEHFQEWLKSEEEGWFFLDSVDEARLSSPQDFEKSILKFKRKIQIATDRTHIIITGRVSAWRRKTDLDYCNEQLPFEKEALFKVVTLDDLTEKQIDLFLEARETPKKEAFLDAVERTNAWAFTSRPQDLIELTEFWVDKGHIGTTRSEIIQNSILRRLAERKQNHADICTLSEEKLYSGAKLLAASITLAKNSVIEIPDGRNNTSGISIHRILSDWNNKERNSLLSRPLFDEAIYGTVRFHHRTVREYLTAQWFSDLLSHTTSRRKIENLFFREQYGLNIITPALRPILAWLALWDEKIREQIYRVAPEILLFEEGDPNSFPPGIRRKLLYKLCKYMIEGKIISFGQFYETARYFAEPVFSDDICNLIQKYAENEHLAMFLFHIVELGKLEKALPEVMRTALNKETELYARIIAFRAIKAIASEKTQESIRQNFLNESSELKRELLIELLEDIQPTEPILNWLFECLKKSEPKEPYAIDRLGNKLIALIDMTQVELLPRFIANLNELLELPPVIERRYCEVSEKFQWLMAPTCNAVKRLILERYPKALEENVFSVLRKASFIHDYRSFDHTDIEKNLATIVPEWNELNRELFWFEVRESRKIEEKYGERLTDFQNILSPMPLWKFEKEDFEYIAEQISRRTSLDDKLVALSLAFDLYKKADQPQKWLARLKALAAHNTELSECLDSYLQPPKLNPEMESYKQQNTIWEKRERIRELEERMYHAYWGNFFKNKTNIDNAKDMLREHPGTITNPLGYLWNWIQRKEKPTSQRVPADWKLLIPEFGEETAHFCKDGIVSFWRHYNLKTVSEGSPPNEVNTGILVGLAGLDIEAKETPDWEKILTSTEIKLACKYATFELNGFPTWFPNLFKAYPEQICDFLMREIHYELTMEKPETDMCRIIYYISWSGKWAWDPLAPKIYDLLREQEPQNPSTLRKLLNILRGSSLADNQLGSLAFQKCKNLSDLKHLVPWFTLWIGATPDMAIPVLKDSIAKIAEPKAQTNFAMEFITHLLPDHRIYEIIARNNFKTTRHLKSLYLMMHQYIRGQEDINHVGEGSYSPQLRDDAQEAREKLFTMLQQIPGKETFLVLQELAEIHPTERYRSRIALRAKERAEEDGDLQPWTSEQIREFPKKLERTPKNHEELAELAILQLLDLKDDLENGDDSIAKTLRRVDKETEMRNCIGHELRKEAFGRYQIPQEEELADAKRPDLRFHGTRFDHPVPVELKLADNWSGPQLGSVSKKT